MKRAALFLLVLAAPLTARGAGVDVSTAALRGHVDALTKNPPRSYVNPARYGEAADYIQRELVKLGLPAALQPFSFKKKDFANVIVVLNPQKKNIVVVGAHYDVAGNGPGADDNASGVAALIEIARVIGPRADKLPYQLQLVAYANEEPPYFRTPGMGSYQHAGDLHGKKASVKLMISLEMVGYYSDKEGSQTYPSKILGWGRPKAGNFIALVSSVGQAFTLRHVHEAFREGSSIPVETASAPVFIKGVDFSDHLNFWKFGFPALMVTDTAFYRNPNYHRSTDTPGTLDYRRMAEVVKGLSYYLIHRPS